MPGNGGGVSRSAVVSVVWARGRCTSAGRGGHAGLGHGAGRSAGAGRGVAGRERPVAAAAEAVSAGGGGPRTGPVGMVRVGPGAGSREIVSAGAGGILRRLVRSPDRCVRDSLGEPPDWEGGLAAGGPGWVAAWYPARGAGLPTADGGSHHG